MPLLPLAEVLISRQTSICRVATAAFHNPTRRGDQSRLMTRNLTLEAAGDGQGKVKDGPVLFRRFTPGCAARRLDRRSRSPRDARHAGENVRAEARRHRGGRQRPPRSPALASLFVSSGLAHPISVARHLHVRTWQNTCSAQATRSRAQRSSRPPPRSSRHWALRPGRAPCGSAGDRRPTLALAPQ